MKRQELFKNAVFTLNTKMVISKTTGEQTTEGGKPHRQATHFSIGVALARTDVKLHNKVRKGVCL